MELILWETHCEKIFVYLNAKNRGYRSLKIFGPLLRYLKNVREVSLIIAFYSNFVRRSFDYG